MTTADSQGNERKIRDLLASANPEAVILALQILESSSDSPDAWRAAIDRGTAFSICQLAAQAVPPDDSEGPPFADRFLAAFEAGFSTASTAGLSDACQRWFKTVDTTKKVGDYARLRLCMYLSPIGLEPLAPDDASMPVVPPEDAAFVAAAIGGTLGQILWRDLALEGRLDLYYEPDSYSGDRLMPESSWRLVGEACIASDSDGCKFICSHGASSSLPWIEQERCIDPAEIRGHIYWHLYYEQELQENLEPRFTEEGLVHSALEGLCEQHLLLADEATFDRRIAKVFESEGEAETVHVKVLDCPVAEGFPQACFRELSEARKDWLADVLIAAAGSTISPESAALAKHVLGWMTIHPATPPAVRERLAAGGFGVTNEPLSQPTSDTPPSEPAMGEKPDRQRTAHLKKIVKAWETICDAEGVADLDRNAFLAAHYAKLVLAKDVILTKAGWELVDEAEGDIIDAVDEGDDEDDE